MSLVKRLTGFLTVTILFVTPALRAQALRVEVIQSIGELKVKKKGTLTKPVVEVRDENNNPVAGAIVTFTLRQGGASGQFESTSSSFADSRTDSAGRASTNLRVTGAGELQINVTASVASSGRKASTVITGSATAATASIASVPLILAVVAAVGGGVALAASRKGDSGPGAPPPVPPRTTISAGSTVVGRP